MISLSTGLSIFVGAQRIRHQGVSRLVPLATARRLRSSFHSSSETSGLQPPDVARLAETARITLSPGEVEDFGPKIRQVIDWFGQLQEVNLESFEPAIRADVEVKVHPREDIPETFENRDAIIEAIPSFEESYIKVPKVLNME